MQPGPQKDVGDLVTSKEWTKEFQVPDYLSEIVGISCCLPGQLHELALRIDAVHPALNRLDSHLKPLGQLLVVESSHGFDEQDFKSFRRQILGSFFGSQPIEPCILDRKFAFKQGDFTFETIIFSANPQSVTFRPVGPDSRIEQSDPCKRDHMQKRKKHQASSNLSATEFQAAAPVQDSDTVAI